MLPETLPTAQGVGDTETKWLALRAFFLWAVQGSNLRPPACKAGALPTELTARVCPQRDSNPRYSLERAVTLTASRWGPRPVYPRKFPPKTVESGRGAAYPWARE